MLSSPFRKMKIFYHGTTWRRGEDFGYDQGRYHYSGQNHAYFWQCMSRQTAVLMRPACDERLCRFQSPKTSRMMKHARYIFNDIDESQAQPFIHQLSMRRWYSYYGRITLITAIKYDVFNSYLGDHEHAVDAALFLRFNEGKMKDDRCWESQSMRYDETPRLFKRRWMRYKCRATALTRRRILVRFDLYAYTAKRNWPSGAF